VLAIVEQEQEPPPHECRHDRLDRIRARCRLCDVEGARHLRHDEARVRHRRKLHDAYTVFERVAHGIRHGVGHARLADAAGADDRDDRVLREQGRRWRSRPRRARKAACAAAIAAARVAAPPARSSPPRPA
jgi:hypothetical protein